MSAGVLVLCLAVVAAALVAGRWRSAPSRTFVAAAVADSADGSPAAVAARSASPDGPARGADALGRFRLEPRVSVLFDSIAAESEAELVVCLPDPRTVIVPRQSFIAPLGLRLEEDCPPDSYAVWHNHPGSAVAPHAACSLSTMDVGIVLRMQPRWAIVQTQEGQRCWWSYGQVVQHALLSRDEMIPVDTQWTRPVEDARGDRPPMAPS